MVTFDDGYRSDYERAYPVLMENEMKAVVAASRMHPDSDAYLPCMIAAYPVDGSTYDKLRRLGELCGFVVDWGEQRKPWL